MVHTCNLAFKALSSLGIINSIEDCYKVVMLILFTTQKKHLEFAKLINMMGSKGLKMFNNVKT
jgi:hypothetical protein